MINSLASNLELDKSQQEKFDNAVKLHQEDQVKEAVSIYLDLWKNQKHAISAINAAALYRKEKNNKDAILLLKEVVSIDSDNGAAWGNLANNLFDIGDPHGAVPAYIRAIRGNNRSLDVILSLVNALKAANMPSLALKVALAAFQAGYKDVSINIVEVLANKNLANDPDISDWIDSVIESIIYRIGIDGILQVKKALSVVHVLIALNRVEQADRILKLATHINVELENRNKKNLMITNLTWNLSCTLLTNGLLEKGWRYYDAGLLVPAAGKQKYQRALFKPFHSDQIPIWRGEDIEDKRILVLGEQAIGDTMMFSLILREFIRKYKCKVSFVCGDRLLNIYRRSMECENIHILANEEVIKTSASLFDYMIPIGSILKFVVPGLSMPYLEGSLLKANPALVKKFYSRYKRSKKSRPLVGLSWRGGGGKKSRVESKSIALDQLLNPIKDMSCDFISLQYGDCQQYVENTQDKIKTTIIYDTAVNAIKDMDRWLAQVAICDYVISIANTTVHGSGGLGIPTFCLVPKSHDWRWIKPDKGYKNSYWYSSVDGVIQEDPNSRKMQLEAMTEWLSTRLSLHHQSLQV